MCDSSDHPFWKYEYLVSYTTDMEVCLLIQDNRSLSENELTALLHDYEQKNGCSSVEVVLGSVALLRREIEQSFSHQPQPQQPYCEWREQQGLPCSQLDLLQSATVIPQRPSPTAELFILGQMLAQITFTLHREEKDHDSDCF